MNNVKHPTHYNQGGIETIDFIKAKLTYDEFRGYCKGNVLKYLSREALKGGDEDLEKARMYLDFALRASKGESLTGGEEVDIDGVTNRYVILTGSDRKGFARIKDDGELEFFDMF